MNSILRPPSSPALSKNSSRRDSSKNFEMRTLLTTESQFPPLCAIKIENEIGDSIFGKILKGELLTPHGVVIPITALTMNTNAQSDDNEFKSEAELLCSLQHPNIV
ncbi:tyrosine-protein kinase transmembrane receptor ROR1-like protein [Leptotrombidium deliense]|uniref:Tyrosine-protein kinase transmembrane receptor ROR1-like protein n=1 Tax=Leptotrombidium deliense TaxID=299467 RepID=A0A443SIE6_9ACAR|nr:tyrosine-protein kinase transmembrane receptor ROR1-like protein [Leptotrombidium deliense]